MLATMRSIARRITRRVADGERGASLVEYVLLLSLIAVVCFGAITYFGNESGNSVNNSRDCIVAANRGQTLPSTC